MQNNVLKGRLYCVAEHCIVRLQGRTAPNNAPCSTAAPGRPLRRGTQISGRNYGQKDPKFSCGKHTRISRASMSYTSYEPLCSLYLSCLQNAAYTFMAQSIKDTGTSLIGNTVSTT